jgi:hypothetical protein
MKKGDNTNNLEHDKEMADNVSESADDLGVINFAKARPFRTYSPKECLNVKQARLLMIAAKDESQGLLKASRATINYPAGGEVYVFTLEGLATDNWRSHLLKDTLSWAPKSNLTKFDAATNLEKTVYACKLDQTFKRLVYHDKLTGKVEAKSRESLMEPRKVMKALRKTGLVREAMAPRNTNQVRSEQRKKRDQNKLALDPNNLATNLTYLLS